MSSRKVASSNGSLRLGQASHVVHKSPRVAYVQRRGKLEHSQSLQLPDPSDPVNKLQAQLNGDSPADLSLVLGDLDRALDSSHSTPRPRPRHSFSTSPGSAAAAAADTTDGPPPPVFDESPQASYQVREQEQQYTIVGEKKYSVTHAVPLGANVKERLSSTSSNQATEAAQVAAARDELRKLQDQRRVSAASQRWSQSFDDSSSREVAPSQQEWAAAAADRQQSNSTHVAQRDTRKSSSSVRPLQDVEIVPPPPMHFFREAPPPAAQVNSNLGHRGARNSIARQGAVSNGGAHDPNERLSVKIELPQRVSALIVRRDNREYVIDLDNATLAVL